MQKLFNKLSPKKVANKIRRIREVCTEIMTNMRDANWRLSRVYAQYLDTLPIVPKTILLEAEHGKVLNGSILRILQHLVESPAYQDYSITLSATSECVNFFNKRLAHYGLLTRVKLCVFSTEAYYRALATSQYLINDTSFIPCFVKREGQIYLNVWRGIQSNRIGRSKRFQHHRIGNLQKNFLSADYLLMSNELTDKTLREEYMLDNLAMGKRLFGGIPRNSVLFKDNQEVAKLKEQLGLADKRIYVYMPASRGSSPTTKTLKSDVEMLYNLHELDARLSDDECVFAFLSPIDKKMVSFKEFKHIRPFPPLWESYDILAIADVLIGDYGRTHIDFANTRRKVVLFTYDKADFSLGQDTYFSVDDLPFPQVTTVDELLDACRSPKDYEENDLLHSLLIGDNAQSVEQLCRHTILGEKCLREEAYPNNGKENVLIYIGDMTPNEITTSAMNLLKAVDATKRNYIALTSGNLLWKYAACLTNLPKEISYVVSPSNDMNFTIKDYLWKILFNRNKMSVATFVKRFKHRFKQETMRVLGNAKIDRVIHFTGFEDKKLLWLSTFNCHRTVYVQTNMLGEIKARRFPRSNILQYVYNVYNRVVLATPGILSTTQSITGVKQTFDVIPSAVDCKDVENRSKRAPFFDKDTQSTHTLAQVKAIFADTTSQKLVNMSAYSPEKGHKRLLHAFKRVLEKKPQTYLFIIGRFEAEGQYKQTCKELSTLGIQNNVVLIYKIFNPYPFMKACDAFVLSSFYEGTFVPFAEADCLGLPIVAPKILSACAFMQAHKGKLQQNSEDGLYEGMINVLDGKICPVNANYVVHNQMVLETFDALWRTP